MHFVGRTAIYFGVAGILLLFFSKFEELNYQNYLRDLKLDATVDLIEVREKVQTTIYARVLDVTELATILAHNPTLNETEFNLKAVDYILDSPEVLNIAVAPNLVVDMVFPKRGNEAVIGLDYRANETQYGKIAKAMQTGEGVITGPVELVQGKLGVILRKPIFVTGPKGIQEPWGIVSLVLDYQKLLEKLDIPELEKQYDIVIQETSVSEKSTPEVLHGGTSLLGKDPIHLDFKFPFGEWELAATPDGGWPQREPDFAWRWAIRSAIILFCLGSLWYIIRLIDKRWQAEKILSTGIEALDHGFVMFDADRRLVAFNEKYKQLAGGSGMVRVGSLYEDIVKANLKNGLIPDAIGQEEEWYEKWSKRLDRKSSDNEQILADGRLIRAYDRPMEDGSVVGLRIDITDLKKAQIAAEAANKAKTDFMGVLSHELRTPLTVILGNAKLAHNISKMPAYRNLVAGIKAHPEFSDELMANLDKVNGHISTMMGSLENSGNHLFSLISEVLDFAKIDSGSLTLDLERTTTAEITNPVADQLRPLVEKKGLLLISNVEDVDLMADVRRIKQVLINIISNATKFTDEGTITLDVYEREDTVVFSVTDTGIGIPEDQLERVFEAFQQVDSTARRKYGGTGLGLAISRDMARIHGGHLTLKSTLGQGSTFTLVLPRRDAEIQASRQASIPEDLVA